MHPRSNSMRPSSSPSNIRIKISCTIHCCQFYREKSSLKFSLLSYKNSGSFFSLLNHTSSLRHVNQLEKNKKWTFSTDYINLCTGRRRSLLYLGTAIFVRPKYIFLTKKEAQVCGRKFVNWVLDETSNRRNYLALLATV